MLFCVNLLEVIFDDDMDNEDDVLIMGDDDDWRRIYKLFMDNDDIVIDVKKFIIKKIEKIF